MKKYQKPELIYETILTENVLAASAVEFGTEIDNDTFWN